MNFINHSSHSYLDSGDALTSITTGVTTAKKLLKALETDMQLSDTSRKTFEKIYTKLDDWRAAAKALVDVTGGKNPKPTRLNFINHSSHSSLDSGDALSCIVDGAAIAKKVLKVLESDMQQSDASLNAFGKEAARLRDWMEASQALIHVTENNEIEEEVAGPSR